MFIILLEYPDIHKKGAVQQAQQIRDIESRMDLLQSVVLNKVPGAMEALDELVYEENMSRESMEVEETPPPRKNLFVRADNNFILSKLNQEDHWILVKEGDTRSLRYLGYTTDLNTDVLKQTHRHRGGILYLPISREPANNYDESYFVQSEICSLEVHTILAQIYFNSIHPYFPMLDRRDYFHRLLSGNSEIEFILLKYSLSAVVAQIVNYLPQLIGMSPFALSKLLIKYVRTELPSQFDRSGIMTVQTCILLSICGMSSMETINPYVYICKI